MASDRHKLYRRKLKLEVLTKYANGHPRCACCFVAEISFLCIDHKLGNGNKHRASIKCGGGHKFYNWLKKEEYPEGYQVLCFNCNSAKWILGECPHKSSIKRKIPA